MPKHVCPNHPLRELKVIVDALVYVDIDQGIHCYFQFPQWMIFIFVFWHSNNACLHVFIWIWLCPCKKSKSLLELWVRRPTGFFFKADYRFRSSAIWPSSKVFWWLVAFSFIANSFWNFTILSWRNVTF